MDQRIRPEAHTAAFEAAWHDLATHCRDTVAPEATYQAWLAHLAINRLSTLHVVREVDFGARYLGPAAAPHFKASGNLMVDVLVLRQPIVALPRRAALGARDLPDRTPHPRSGLGPPRRLLRHHRTQSLCHTNRGARLHRSRPGLPETLRRPHRRPSRTPGPAPARRLRRRFANAKKSRFNFDHLRPRLADAEIRPDVQMAVYDAQTGQVTIEDGRGQDR